jgi:cytochrome c-type biogenesis protein
LLGSILILAGSQETVSEGIFLLAIYSGGLAIPFMLISAFIHLILNFVKKASQFLKHVNRAAGILLIIMGIILIFDRLYLLIQTG